MRTLLLAHGGTVGLIFEIGFLAVPVAIFGVLAVASKRRQQDEDEAEGGE